MVALKTMPKLELHAHLNGSLSIETLRELGKLGDNTNLKTEWPKWESALTDLSSCFVLFDIAYNLTQTIESITLATVRTIQEFSEDGVIYLELRSTPRVIKNGGKADYILALIDGVINAKTVAPDITVTAIISVNRSESFEMAEENVKLAVDFSEKYPDIVVGVELSGNPSIGNFSDFVDLLKGVKSSLKVAVHFGEIQNDKEVAEILQFEADRLGHGTFLSEENLEILREKKTPVEICLSSNVKCGTVPRLDRHHFKKLYSMKHPVILSTDDKGVFSTTLTTEYELAQQHFDLSIDDLWLMNYNAVNYIFASESVKNKVKDRLLHWKEERFITSEPL